jgi:hypothetical protein
MAKSKGKAAPTTAHNDVVRARLAPNVRRLTIIAQDPAVKVGGRILTTQIEIPAEELADGPCGYRVNVIDYDVSTNTLYSPAIYRTRADGTFTDPFAASARGPNRDRLLIENPHFHAQNTYAIVMKTLARFEHALGRRIAWGSDGHQLHVAPHAFADANAFYSRQDRGLYFGYFADAQGKPVYTCLSHDIVAHETTHALLDGLRRRFMEPSSPDQAAFHEGFADVVALLSVFAQQDVVAALLAPQSRGRTKLIDKSKLTKAAIKQSVLLGLAEQMGEALSGARGQALRRSVRLMPGRNYMTLPEFMEPHRRGEVIVAAMLNTFVAIWDIRLKKIGYARSGLKDLGLVVEEGARVADHLLTMSIRALDYCPTTDINFSDYLSALLTIDHEVVPDDSKYGYRHALLANFADYGIKPARHADKGGVWRRCNTEMIYSRTHFDSMLRDKEEVFRFIWENRQKERLDINEDGYIEVESVRPCSRIAPDGFILRETVAEYVQILTLRVEELAAFGIKAPPEMLKKPTRFRRVRLFGGAALIFDEYGKLKYQIRNRLEDADRQQKRLAYLWETGFFEQSAEDAAKTHFAELHLARSST